MTVSSVLRVTRISYHTYTVHCIWLRVLYDGLPEWVIIPIRFTVYDCEFCITGDQNQLSYLYSSLYMTEFCMVGYQNQLSYLYSSLYMTLSFVWWVTRINCHTAGITVACAVLEWHVALHGSPFIQLYHMFNYLCQILVCNTPIGCYKWRSNKMLILLKLMILYMFWQT